MLFDRVEICAFINGNKYKNGKKRNKFACELRLARVKSKVILSCKYDHTVHMTHKNGIWFFVYNKISNSMNDNFAQ